MSQVPKGIIYHKTPIHRTVPLSCTEIYWDTDVYRENWCGIDWLTLDQKFPKMLIRIRLADVTAIIDYGNLVIGDGAPI